MTRQINDNPGGWSRALPGHTVEYEPGFAEPFYFGGSLVIAAGANATYTLTFVDTTHIYFINMISITPQAYKEMNALISINDDPYVGAGGIGWLNIPLSQNPSIQLISGDHVDVLVTNLDAAQQTFLVKINGTKVKRSDTYGHAPGCIWSTVADVGAAPFEIEGTDGSTFTPTAWDWDFGDGSPHQYTAHVHHIFTTPGTYWVVLKVTNAYGWDTFAWPFTVT